MIARSRRYLNSIATRSLYFGFVHPYLTFGNIAWASTHRSKLLKIHNMQKRAVRIITKAHKWAHSRPLMMQNKILNVFEINLLQNLTFVYKHNHNMLPAVFAPCLHRISHKYNTRLSKFGYKEKASTGRGAFCISTRAPHLWNRIERARAKASKTLQSFTKEVKHYLLQSPDMTSIW